jgi:hypothetical protein
MDGTSTSAARPDLRTRDQKWQDRQRDLRWDKMYVSRGMILSEAFASLRTPAAFRVLFIFLSKCRWEQVRRPCTREKTWTITNNGEIVFSYLEAKDRYGMTDGVFRRAIDELVAAGFIDVAHSGYGLRKDMTLYGVSDRWERYGTSEFKRAERQKRVQKMGFRKGNQHGKNAREKDLQQLSATVVNSHE